MSGLLNLVPRYLPRYGMAPRWAEAIRWLVIAFTVINLIVTIIFDASVEAQGGAYATGVLMLMCNDCVMILIVEWRRRVGKWYQRLSWGFLITSLVFIYTTIAVVIEKPEGIKIAVEKAEAWIKKGAQPSNTVKILLARQRGAAAGAAKA